MIIGVTGNYASGKDTVAEILEKMNFFHVSFSDLIREELKSRKQEINRDNLINLGNELRKNYGPSILARMALEKVKDGENYVFTSIRNPGEVELLKKRDDFILVNTICPDNIRIKRIVSRNRLGDPKTLKELKEKEKKENSSDPNAQQLHTVAKMARITLSNDSILEKLNDKVEKLVSDWMYKMQDRIPYWDKYYMDIAEAIKMRCNCMSSKKGAIVVKDKKLVSTGYNGSPKSIKHCSDGGCERCTLRHLGKMKSGKYNAPCICVHAEANAIIQAAYHGISTKDATLYTTFTPCTECAKLIINAGISRVIAKTVYPDDTGIRLLKEAKIKFEVFKC